MAILCSNLAGTRSSASADVLTGSRIRRKHVPTTAALQPLSGSPLPYPFLFRLAFLRQPPNLRSELFLQTLDLRSFTRRLFAANLIVQEQFFFGDSRFVQRVHFGELGALLF